LVVLAIEQQTDSPEQKRAREAMVKHDVEARGINDLRVLEAMRTVPRHLFVPARVEPHAYADSPLPIGAAQTISQPYMVALMTELCQLDGSERVLEIGTGSGYQAAVLGELAAEVYSIEILDTLANTARRRLSSLGYDNVTVLTGDGFRGWPEQAPYDAIIVTCAAKQIPEPLKEQLRDGGRMVIPVGDDYQELTVVTRNGDTYAEETVIPVRFVPMTGEAQQHDNDDQD
jgi:protein-L-isoaspartate(D-aspartate) O-methyltransferase